MAKNRMLNRRAALPSNDALYAELTYLYGYDSENGGFTWVNRRTPRQPKPGARVGGSDGRGYLMCLLLGHKFKVHQLVWLWHHKELSTSPLDHVNGIRTDNRIENLRQCSDLENLQNLAKVKSVSTGVRARDNGTFYVKVVHKGRLIPVGTFKTHEEARAAYVNKKRELSGDFSPV